jgi:hypothetical protein
MSIAVEETLGFGQGIECLLLLHLLCLLLYLDLPPSSLPAACNAGFIPSPVLDSWCSLLHVTHYSRSSRFLFLLTSQPNRFSISDFLDYWIRIGSRAGTLGRRSPFCSSSSPMSLFSFSFSLRGNPVPHFLFRLVCISLELAIHTHPRSSHTRSVLNIPSRKEKRSSDFIQIFHLLFSSSHC